MLKYTFLLTVLVVLGVACGSKTNTQGDNKNPTNITNNDPSHTENWKDEKRFALVIGNADYDAKGITPLKNPVNDADAVSKTLKDLQFEVTTVTNADRNNMWGAIDRFVEKLAANPASVGLFYYAGHGLELKGTNYLLPVSVKVGSQNPESDVDRDAYKLQDLITRLENAKNRLNMIFLDACRDNPFPKVTRSIASRGMTSVSTNAEIFVGYSTATGATANDGESSTNSPFAAAFVESIKQQGRDISGVYKDITAKVVQNTNNVQRPWNGGSLTREFYFVPSAKTVENPIPVNPIVMPAKPEVEKPVVTTPTNEPKKEESKTEVADKNWRKKYYYVGYFTEGLVEVQKNEDGKFGYVDKQGNEITTLQYDNVLPFSEGMAMVESGGKRGFINKLGQEVIPLIYENEGFNYFRNGLVDVRKNGKWGYIDKKGNVVVAFQYDYTYGFSEGLAWVKKNGKYGYVDRTGNEVITLQYEDTWMYGFEEGLAEVKKNGKWGYINKMGIEVIPFEYDEAFGFKNGSANVIKNGKSISIDKMGKCIKDCP